MSVLSRDQIIAADSKLPIEELHIPSWGGSVYVRAMTGAERDRFETDYQTHKTANLRARLAVATLCDAAGVLLFTPKDAAELGKKSAAALDVIFPVAARLSGITKADVDDLEKNSASNPSGSSPSDSPPTSE